VGTCHSRPPCQLAEEATLLLFNSGSTSRSLVAKFLVWRESQTNRPEFVILEMPASFGFRDSVRKKPGRRPVYAPVSLHKLRNPETHTRVKFFVHRAEAEKLAICTKKNGLRPPRGEPGALFGNLVTAGEPLGQKAATFPFSLYLQTITFPVPSRRNHRL